MSENLIRLESPEVFTEPFQYLTAKGGLGVVSMKERVRHVGGTLSIESHVSSGTRLTVRVPLKNASRSGYPPQSHRISG